MPGSRWVSPIPRPSTSRSVPGHGAGEVEAERPGDDDRRRLDGPDVSRRRPRRARRRRGRRCGRRVWAVWSWWIVTPRIGRARSETSGKASTSPVKTRTVVAPAVVDGQAELGAEVDDLAVRVKAR